MNPEKHSLTVPQLLRRARNVAGIVVLLLSLTALIYAARKGQALDKLYEAGGGAYTYEGWLRKALPSRVQSRIRANTFGPLKRAFARNWGRRLERLEYVWLRDSEQTEDALEQIAPYLGSVRSMYLGQSMVTDSSMVHLSGLISVDEINLEGAQITDEGLVHLRDCKKLSRLNLSGTEISDAGLLNLTTLPALSQICLEDLDVTDLGLEYLSKISTLKEIRVTGDITNAGLAHLSNLPHLENLSVRSSSRLTYEGIAHLKSLPNLKLLSIHSPEFGDAEMAAVGELRKLIYLRVSGEGISNDGLTHLRSLTNLNDVYFENTSITDEGLPKLYSLTNLDWVDFQRNRGVSKEAVAKFKIAVPGSRPVGGR